VEKSSGKNHESGSSEGTQEPEREQRSVVEESNGGSETHASITIHPRQFIQPSRQFSKWDQSFGIGSSSSNDGHDCQAKLNDCGCSMSW
jgi:hypothetical protein